jgi:hypothetical protein
MLEKGVKPDPKDSYGWTPLWCAAERGHEATVKLLEQIITIIQPTSPPTTETVASLIYWFFNVLSVSRTFINGGDILLFRFSLIVLCPLSSRTLHAPALPINSLDHVEFPGASMTHEASVPRCLECRAV